MIETISSMALFFGVLIFFMFLVGDPLGDISRFLDRRNERKVKLLQAKAQLEKAKKQ